MTASIRGQLLAWLLGALVIAGLLIGYSAYHRAQEDIDELLVEEVSIDGMCGVY